MFTDVPLSSAFTFRNVPGVTIRKLSRLPTARLPILPIDISGKTASRSTAQSHGADKRSGESSPFFTLLA